MDLWSKSISRGLGSQCRDGGHYAARHGTIGPERWDDRGRFTTLTNTGFLEAFQDEVCCYEKVVLAGRAEGDCGSPRSMCHVIIHIGPYITMPDFASWNETDYRIIYFLPFTRDSSGRAQHIPLTNL